MLLLNLLNTMKILLVMLGVAFLTLVERKLLGLIQIRLGVNKTTLKGILQPVIDAGKLLFKESSFSSLSLDILMMILSLLVFCLSLMLFDAMNHWMSTSTLNTLIFILILMGMELLILYFIALKSTNKFSLMSSLRVMTLSLVTEGVILTALFFIVFHTGSVSLSPAFLFLFTPMVMMWVLLLLLFLMRSPWDYIEAESELISGTNTEYSSVLFTLQFLSEYSNIIWVSMITSYMYFNSMLLPYLLIFLIIVLIRGVMPRALHSFSLSSLWVVLMPSLVILLTMILTASL